MSTLDAIAADPRDAARRAEAEALWLRLRAEGFEIETLEAVGAYLDDLARREPSVGNADQEVRGPRRYIKSVLSEDASSRHEDEPCTASDPPTGVKER